MEVGTLVNMVAETAKELTNLVGLIEKNLASYDRIKARFRRKRVVGRLEAILERLTVAYEANLATLWVLADRLTGAGADPKWVTDRLEENRSIFTPGVYNGDLRRYLLILLHARDLIEEFKGDIVHVDYRLYEQLHEAVHGRVNVIEMLLNEDGQSISVDKLKEAYLAYVELAKSVGTLKDKLQDAAKKGSRQPRVPRSSSVRGHQRKKAQTTEAADTDD